MRPNSSSDRSDLSLELMRVGFPKHGELFPYTSRARRHHVLCAADFQRAGGDLIHLGKWFDQHA